MWLDRLWSDVRYGLRLFAKSPGFTAVAVISIACGTGANVAMFSAADTLLLRPIPVRNATSLITVGSLEPDSVLDIVVASYPDFVDIRDRTTTLTGLVAYHSRRAGLGVSSSSPRQNRLVTAVSGNFFDDFGIPLAMGRGFLPDEDRVRGRNPVAVIDNGLWRGMFSAAPDVVGRTLLIGRQTYTIVGVTHPSFTGVEGLTAEAVYVPLAMWPELAGTPDLDPLTARDFRVLTVKGRLRDGVTLDEARSEMAIIGGELTRRYPATNARAALVAQTEFQARISRGPVVAPLIMVLSILAMMVLGVACANVAGLLAGRAPLRARELGLRLAIGAGRGRLVAQLLTESLAIAVAGAVGGVAVGWAGIALIRQIQLPTDSFAIPRIEMNERVLVFSLILAATSAVVFGLGPALTSTRIDLSHALRVAEQGGVRRWRLTGRNTLVALQVALSLALLTIAVIAFQTFVDAFGRGPGFRTTQMAKIDVDATQAGYADDRAAALFERLAAETRTIPGVTAATVTSAMPLGSIEMAPVMDMEYRRAEGEWSAAPFSNVVDEHYLTTMEIPLLRGRDFRVTDDATTPRVGIVNETMARRYWPGEEAVGKRLLLAGRQGGTIEIVGVARDSVYLYPAELPQKMLYLPLRQNPRGIMVLLAQTSGASAGPLPAIREIVRRADPALSAYDAQTIERFYDALAVSISRIILTLVGGIGLMGVAITVIGLYGLVSYAVNRRTREIGIRAALGATYARLLAMLMRQGLTPVWFGLAGGIALSAITDAGFSALVPFSKAYDVWTVALLVPALCAVTAAAAFVPARRAATVDPMIALREE